MKIDDVYIIDIASLLLRCEDLTSEEWDLCSFVFDVAEGSIANSGFLYKGDEVSPSIAEVESEPLLLDDKIIEFREKIYEESGHKFKQLLIQMESKTNRIKIDFEFDDPSRWSIKPAKLKEMREKLRPDFS